LNKLDYKDTIPSDVDFKRNSLARLAPERIIAMTQNPPDTLMDRKTAARYLRVSPGTLAVWDCTKRYDLKPLKVGRSVRYRKSDLDSFVERQLTK
jgi:hypothetical protein